MKQTALKYGITGIIGALMVWLALDLRGFGLMTDAAEKYRALADAFTIPGIILIMLWLLVILSGEGVFDGISYALNYTVSLLVPGMGGKRQEAYADYLERKSAHRADGKKSRFLLYTGLCFILPAVLFIILFYQV